MVKAAPEGRVLLGGRRAGLFLMGLRFSFLADHSYESADLTVAENRDGRTFVPFGGVGWLLKTILVVLKLFLDDFLSLVLPIMKLLIPLPMVLNP
jgi:hypothetical protein